MLNYQSSYYSVHHGAISLTSPHDIVHQKGSEEHISQKYSKFISFAVTYSVAMEL